MSIKHNWKHLRCEDCGNKNNPEFSTGDGDKPKSIILCEKCAICWKSYVMQYINNNDYYLYFGKPYCQICDNNNIKELRIPRKIKFLHLWIFKSPKV